MSTILKKVILVGTILDPNLVLITKKKKKETRDLIAQSDKRNLGGKKIIYAQIRTRIYAFFS